jgi:sulfide dehydrogenase cytochrome subunit
MAKFVSVVDDYSLRTKAFFQPTVRKQKMKIVYLYLVTTMSLAALPLVSTAHVDALMQDCNGCHGENGVSQWTDIPTIAGMVEFVHSDALYIYKDGERSCAETEYRQGDTSRAPNDMCKVAASLSDDDIEALAAAYDKFEYVRAKQEFDATLAAAGESVHNEHCDRCHSDGGTNPDDESGMLGGQWMGYMKSSFAEYLAGEREQSNKMKEKMDLLSDDDVTALLHYYASQQ